MNDILCPVCHFGIETYCDHRVGQYWVEWWATTYKGSKFPPQRTDVYDPDSAKLVVRLDGVVSLDELQRLLMLV
jgi:hypothetical protein